MESRGGLTMNNPSISDRKVTSILKVLKEMLERIEHQAGEYPIGYEWDQIIALRFAIETVEAQYDLR
jgi:hypothetical protein